MRVIASLLALIILVSCQQSVEIEQAEPLPETPIQEEEELIPEVEEEQAEKIEEEPVVSYQINKDNWKVEPLQDEGKQVVLLTIDDAPDQYAVEMAEALQQADAAAIFFVNGHFIADEEGKEKLKLIHDMGFEIGNHTMSHPNMSQISSEEQRQEMIELNDLIEEIIGERPRFYRAPFGVNTDTSKAVAEEEGMTSMNWTYGYDWEKEYQHAEALANIMVNTSLLTDGANVLMHDRQWTAKALTDIINGLREKGFDIVDPKQIETN